MLLNSLRLGGLQLIKTVKYNVILLLNIPLRSLFTAEIIIKIQYFNHIFTFKLTGNKISNFLQPKLYKYTKESINISEE